MLDQLLESRRRARRSTSQVAASVVAHTAVIGAAVFATANAHVRHVDETPTRVVFPRTYRPPPRTTVTTVRPTDSQHRFPSVWIDPAIALPGPALTPVLPDMGIDVSEFRKGSLSSVGTNGTETPRSLGEAYRDDQVELPAGLAAGNAPPEYPEQLRRNGIEGKLVATFIIDTTGKAEPASIRFARDGNALFEASVRSALTRMHFTPARIGGTRVRQIVEMPFLFTLNR